MSELPVLDDRAYADFAAEARALIPTLAPGWTDHNPTDPGIMLIELLAWLADMVMYRVDRVPERSYRTFLRLLRGSVPTGPNGAELPLAEAIRATLAELRERHRAITADDFVYLTLQRWPALEAAARLGALGVVRRASCIPEHGPATLPQAWKPSPPRDEGHFTVIVVPDSLAASRGDLASFAPARRYALELDGAGAIDCGNHASLSLTGALTLSAWIFPRDLARGRQGIVAKQAAGEFELYLEPDGTLGFRHADGKDGGASEAKVKPYRWTHVAAVRTAQGALSFYLDGEPGGTAALAKAAAASVDPLRIGQLSGGAGSFDGFIRDVCLWSVARTAVEIGGDMRRRPPGLDDRAPPPAGLVASWRLEAPAAPIGGGPPVTPDAETAPASAKRLRDGRPSGSVKWRDVVRPLPAGAALVQGLGDLFDEWRLLTTHVHVMDQRPLRVKVSASLYLRTDGVPADVARAAALALDGFLDPLRGGSGDGWPFGRAIYLSDLTAALDGLAGVDFVDGVAVTIVNDVDPARPPAPADEQGKAIGVSIQPYELPALDSTQLTIYQRVGTKWQAT